MPRKRKPKGMSSDGTSKTTPSGSVHNVEEVFNNEDGEVFRNCFAVGDDVDPHESLKHMQEIFEGKLEPDVVSMIFSECAYNVDQALETLISLSNDSVNDSRPICKNTQPFENECVAKFKEMKLSDGVVHTFFPYQSSGLNNSESMVLKAALEPEKTDLCNTNSLDHKLWDVFVEENVPQFLDDGRKKTGTCTQRPTRSVTCDYSEIIKSNRKGTLFENYSSNQTDKIFYSPPLAQKMTRQSAPSYFQNSSQSPTNISSVPRFITPLIPTSGKYNTGVANGQLSHRHLQDNSSILDKNEKSFLSKHKTIPKNYLGTPNGIQNITKAENDIIWKIHTGEKILVILRGLPGSGKTTLAKRLQYSGVIFSTDDYFITKGKYRFDFTKIQHAHQWNVRRAKRAMENGKTPVIIDNTNTEAWEMKPYVVLGVKYSYNIHLLEPNTQWKFRVGELSRKNIHKVHKNTIERMLNRYDHNITVESIIKIINNENTEKSLPLVTDSQLPVNMNVKYSETINEDSDSQIFMSDEEEFNVADETTTNDSLSDSSQKLKSGTGTIFFEAVVHRPDEHDKPEQFTNIKTVAYSNGNVGQESVLVTDDRKTDDICNDQVKKFIEKICISEMNHTRKKEEEESDNTVSEKENLKTSESQQGNDETSEQLTDLKDLMVWLQQDSEESQSLSRHTSTSCSSQDMSGWEAITEHDDDFLWTADLSTETDYEDKIFQIKEEDENRGDGFFNELRETSEKCRLIAHSPISEEIKANEDESTFSSEKENAFLGENEECNSFILNGINLVETGDSGMVTRTLSWEEWNQSIHLPKNNSDSTPKPQRMNSKLPNRNEFSSSFINLTKSHDFKYSNDPELCSENVEKLLKTDDNVKWASDEPHKDDDVKWTSNETNHKDDDVEWISNETNSKDDDVKWTSNETNHKDDDVEWISNETNSKDDDVKWTSNETSHKDDVKWTYDEINHKDHGWDAIPTVDELESTSVVSESPRPQRSFIEFKTEGTQHFFDTLPSTEIEPIESTTEKVKLELEGYEEKNTSMYQVKASSSLNKRPSSKIGKKRIAASFEKFLGESVDNILESNWTVPPFVTDEDTSIAPVEILKASSVVKMISVVQTEPADFILLHKIENGLPYETNLNVLIPNEYTTESHFTDVEIASEADLSLRKAQKIVCFDKSTTMDDFPEDMEVNHKLKFLHSCFPEVSDEDLKDMFNICCGDHLWVANILMDSGYKYNRISNDNNLKLPLLKIVEECDLLKGKAVDISATEPLKGSLSVKSTDNFRSILKQNLETVWGLEPNEEHKHIKETTLNESQYLNSSEQSFSHIENGGIPNSNQNKNDSISENAMCSDGVDTNDSSLLHQFKNEVTHNEKPPENFQKNLAAERCFTIPQGLELTLDPAFALQLEELFGPVGSDMSQGSLTSLNLTVMIDMDMAKQIHKKWKESVSAMQNANRRTANKKDGYNLYENVSDKPESELEKYEDKLGVLAQETLNDENFQKRDFDSHFMLSRYNQNMQQPQETTQRTRQQVPPLSEIMDMEYALQLSRKEMLKPRKSKEKDLATKLKLLKLYNMFPGADETALDAVFEANNSSLANTVIALEADIGQPAKLTEERKFNELEKELSQFADMNNLQDFINEDWSDWIDQEASFTDEDEAAFSVMCSTFPESESLRAEATLHYHLRRECLSKAQTAFHQGMRAVASFYAEQGQVHAQKLREANKRASKKILEARNSGGDPLVLDLHGLYVQEALGTLDKFFRAKSLELKNQQAEQLTVSIITGRGIHSARRARLRPAVMDFLKRAGYRYDEIHSGMFKVTLMSNSRG